MPTVMDQQITAVFTDFAFNVELDDSLFSLKVPKEYNVETTQWDASSPQEDDLIDMLHLWAERTDGRFPSVLNMNAITEFSEAGAKKRTREFDKNYERSEQLFEEFRKLSKQQDELRLPQKQLIQELKKNSDLKEQRRILKQFKEEHQKSSKQIDELNQQIEHVMQQIKERTKRRSQQIEDSLKNGLSENLQDAQNKMMPIVRGIMFVQELPDESDWHYVGKDVKFGDAESPIFWYKPEGSQTYRVLYGDLSIKDVSPENLPQ